MTNASVRSVALFPGQGIRPKDILATLDEDHPLLEQAGEILRFPLKRRVAMAARTPNGKLMTSVAQPSIFVASCIGYERSLEGDRRFHAFAGHSLGEYAALVAAGSMSFADALLVVRARGDAMQAVARTTPGGMAALMGLPMAECEAIARRAGVEVANDNAPGQVVIAGTEAALARAAGHAAELGGRSVLLDVAGPFHSEAMARAEEPLRAALESVEIRTPKAPVLCNVTARPYGSAREIRAMLVAQLSGRVRWRESIEWLCEQGAEDFVDVGPANVVGGLVRKIRRSMEVIERV